MAPEFMSDALDDLRAHEAENTFAARQRAATRALVSDYSDGSGPAIAEGLASADRSLAAIEAASEPAASTVPDPRAGYDAVLRYYGIDPVALRTFNPVGYLLLGQAYFIDLARIEALASACMAGVLAAARMQAERKPYIAKLGAGRAIRHSLHQTGVL